jgi:hypothetical protein
VLDVLPKSFPLFINNCRAPDRLEKNSVNIKPLVISFHHDVRNENHCDEFSENNDLMGVPCYTRKN